ncbi:MAG: glycosyl transferase family 25 [Phycisphaera sp.]|nr:glycosyl transferase family 25 [Phycisphaera sp.]
MERLIMELINTFDRVVCINLDRRPDRWKRLAENVAGCGWPFKQPIRYPAIDGRSCPPPPWWRCGNGAWGCHQSHVRILEDALRDNIRSILILEDDAVLPQRFGDLVSAFLDSAPDDWDAIMLGGQHLRPPKPVNSHTVRVRNGNRTHAHALRGRYIKAAYTHLCRYPDHSRHPGHHVDHRLGILHESGKYNVYAPTSWLVGQADGRSDIAHRDFGLRFWTGAPSKGDGDNLPPFVAVVGLHRSGSSCLAGVLHHLGVHMGNRLNGYEPAGGFEAEGLAHLCERAYPFPSTNLAIPCSTLIEELRGWIGDRRREAHWKNSIAGGKYPHLCAMGEELQTVCGRRLRVIHIDRPLDRSIESLKERSRKEAGWLNITDEQCERVQRWLWERKTAFLAGVDHLTIGFDDLRADPVAQVGRVIAFLGIDPTEAQRAAAVRHVRADVALGV